MGDVDAQPGITQADGIPTPGVPSAYQYSRLARVYYFLGSPAKSLAAFDEALRIYPDHPVLLRHRGHRFITERDFDAALADLSRAAELAETVPDEIEFYQAQVEEELRALILGHGESVSIGPIVVNPNSLEQFEDVYKGTLRNAIWYHIGLIHYLRADFGLAAEAYQRALAYCHDDDMRVATIDWLYLSLSRASRHDEAAEVLALVRDDMHVLERSYFSRLRVYRGKLDPYELLARAGQGGNYATQTYGVGAWLLCQGRTSEAVTVFESVLNLARPTSFGHICSEVELTRLRAGSGSSD